jgi:dihydrofolate synthase / folylpolyglutamate synthase
MSVQIGDGEIYRRFLTLHPKSIDLSLDRMRGLLDKLGNPERRLPKVIHVAGTNGKGSTTAFCRAMLEAAGHRVHVYTSPHLVRFNERVRLAGRIVEDGPLMEAMERCERVNAGAAITFFEITTVAALLLFAETPADFLVLEVGLGGRLDTTNVVDDTMIAIITPVSMDHEKFLGDRLELIAAEKAGILKRGAPAVVSRQADEALAVIERQAARLKCPLHVSGQHWTSMEERGRLVFQDEAGLLDLPAPRLLGRHQFENAGAAIAAMRVLGPEVVPEAAIATGLTTVEWPARLQRLEGGRLRKLLPADAELWLDGGHNPGAGEVIAAAMAEIEERVPRPLILVAGMKAAKDATGFFRPFKGLARRVLAITIPDDTAVIPADELAGVAAAAGLEAEAAADLEGALVAAGHVAPRPRVLICGSLYLAGHVLKADRA